MRRFVSHQPQTLTFLAILDLNVKNRSNHQNDIKNEFLEPKSPRNHVLYSIICQTIEKVIFLMADGGHFGFGALTELAHIFMRDMGAKKLF